MRRYKDQITLNVDVDVNVSEVLSEIDTEEILDEFLRRPDKSGCNPDTILKTIISLLGLPEWYRNDEDAVVREVRKLF